MQQSFAQRLGSVARFIGSLLLTVVAGGLAWFFYQQHLDQQQYNQVIREGTRVVVTTTDVNRASRTRTDAFMNVAYISFDYQQKAYTIRYHQDSSWLSTGDRVTLYYHPGLDRFRQPRGYGAFSSKNRQSKLIGYTFLHGWNAERKWLVATLALTAIFVILACGLLAMISGLSIFRLVGRIIFIGLLLTGVAYLSYNSWRYYQYYHQVKSGGKEATVQVLSTSRHAVSRRSSWWYTYEATVLHNKQERVIPIEESEYDRLKPGDPLQAYYNPTLNDMMSVNHTPDNTNLLAAAFAGLLLIIVGWQSVKKLRRQRTA
ncbi:hypothetical protein [Paraflavitalea pollutisoli]|uniref:hypothetical protein n=1 Tax=Paraflavitalea pollutisoli TaxID=3034143 RepID=UPI0023ECF51E|nr:hypothetical protein [Paraflavitalea sp. H1-2-19X]